MIWYYLLIIIVFLVELEIEHDWLPKLCVHYSRYALQNMVYTLGSTKDANAKTSSKVCVCTYVCVRICVLR